MFQNINLNFFHRYYIIIKIFNLIQIILHNKLFVCVCDSSCLGNVHIIAYITRNKYIYIYTNDTTQNYDKHSVLTFAYNLEEKKKKKKKMKTKTSTATAAEYTQQNRAKRNVCSVNCRRLRGDENVAAEITPFAPTCRRYTQLRPINIDDTHLL